MSPDPSEIILICWFAAQWTFIFIINMQTKNDMSCCDDTFFKDSLMNSIWNINILSYYNCQFWFNVSLLKKSSNFFKKRNNNNNNNNYWPQTHTHIYIYTYIHTYTHTHTQVHLKKIEYRGNLFFFFLLISKSETFIYFRFIACKVKHFKSFFCFNFDD